MVNMLHNSQNIKEQLGIPRNTDGIPKTFRNMTEWQGILKNIPVGNSEEYYSALRHSVMNTQEYLRVLKNTKE